MRRRPALLPPALFYTMAFFALTWPAVLRFRTHWYADQGDGLQNVWNIWWIRYAVTVLHQNPWRTDYLHYPYGTSLVGHTLNPFNGFVAILPSLVFSPVTVHNAIVTGAFVVAGVTTFLLAYQLTAAYWPSLIAGFIFTFSSFHFEHAEGHLQLVSLEWIPLFLLAWIRFLASPTIARGAAAALVLFLVILCDYYYFLYCVIAGVVVFAWWAGRAGGARTLRAPDRARAFLAFALVALATSGVLAVALLRSSSLDPLVGTHRADEFSMDLLAPIVYGGHWRFGWLTRPYWIRLQANYHESSVYVGLSVIGLLALVWRARERLDAPVIRVMFVLLAGFLLLALGPTLQIGGRSISWSRQLLPYAWLERLFPPLAISGVPIRMMVMVTLVAAVLAAFGFRLLLDGSVRQRRTAVVLAVLLAIEYLPRPIPTLQVAVPGWVGVLSGQPGHDGVLDTASGQSAMLYYQTIHEKPIALGYIARVPESVAARDAGLRELIGLERFDRLWPDYRLRYVVSRASTPTLKRWPGARLLWDGDDTALFDVSGLTARPASGDR